MYNSDSLFRCSNPGCGASDTRKETYRSTRGDIAGSGCFWKQENSELLKKSEPQAFSTWLNAAYQKHYGQYGPAFRLPALRLCTVFLTWNHRCIRIGIIRMALTYNNVCSPSTVLPVRDLDYKSSWLS